MPRAEKTTITLTPAFFQAMAKLAWADLDRSSRDQLAANLVLRFMGHGSEVLDMVTAEELTGVAQEVLRERDLKGAVAAEFTDERLRRFVGEVVQGLLEHSRSRWREMVRKEAGSQFERLIAGLDGEIQAEVAKYAKIPEGAVQQVLQDLDAHVRQLMRQRTEKAVDKATEGLEAQLIRGVSEAVYRKALAIAESKVLHQEVSDHMHQVAWRNGLQAVQRAVEREREGEGRPRPWRDRQEEGEPRDD